MSTQNAVETEVKIAVSEWDTGRLAEIGLSVVAPRVFEANFVYDTPEQSLRGCEMLLRLRTVGDRIVLTWKGPHIPGPHKSRPELEVTVSSYETLNEIFGHLGYQVMFQYEKYRTEFSAGAGTVVFDETPIGNFLELEGTPDWIDETAATLGFTPNDYVLESYSKLYVAHCAKLGVQPLNMVFSSSV